MARFSQFDAWENLDYVQSQRQEKQNAGDSKHKNSDLPEPVAWFAFEDDWDEMDVPLDGVKSGQFVLVKFLRPRGSSAERLGIVGVKFYGYKRKPPFLSDLAIDKTAPMGAKDEPATSSVTTAAAAPKAEQAKVVSGVDAAAVFMRVLGFIVDVSENQMAIHQKSKAPGGLGDAAVVNARSSSTGLLDYSDLNMDCLWRLLEAVGKRGNGGGEENDNTVVASARVHVILLLHILTPILTEKTGHPEHRGASNRFLKLLCSFIDREKIETGGGGEGNGGDGKDEEDDLKRKRTIRECERRIATMTLTDGAAVFFPDKEARRKQLFSMMTTSTAAEPQQRIGDSGEFYLCRHVTMKCVRGFISKSFK